jgi:CheY-like chemotaxis protein
MSNVVILDGDEALRELWAEWLAADGHALHQAQPPGAPEASEIDVVLIDLPRPRDGALAAVAAVRARYPRAVLIGLSTQLVCSLPQRSAAAAELGLQALLAKPCSRAELTGLLAP